MGSGGSKQEPNSSNNAGPSSNETKKDKQTPDNNAGPFNETKKEKQTPDNNTKLPPLSPPISTAGQTKTTGSKVTKLTEVPSNEQKLNEEAKDKGSNSSVPKGDKSLESVGETSKQDYSVESKHIKPSNTTVDKSEIVEEDFMEPEDQRKFDDAVSSVCVLVKPESLMKKVTNNVTKLQLFRALPWNYDFYDFLSKFSNLQEIDISNNNIGPQSFRSVCLAMCNNVTVTSLNLADNMADTDSSECLGKMLTLNKTLVYLNVSSNNLGKDYFSRCVGPALKMNSTLKTLRAQSIGSSDMRAFMEGLKENTALTDIDLSNNALIDRTVLGKGFGEKLKDPACTLTSISLASCEISSAGIESFIQGFEANTSLEELNLNGNEFLVREVGTFAYFESLKKLGKLVVIAMNSSTMRNLSLDTLRIKDKTISTTDITIAVKEDLTSHLQILSLNDSSLTDQFWTSIGEVFQGRQIPLAEINIGSNPDMSAKCLDSIISLTSVMSVGLSSVGKKAEIDPEGVSTLRKVNYSLNSQCTGLSESLVKLKNLQYVNVKRCRIKDLHELANLYTTGNLTTLVLDNLKMASTDTLQKLMENCIGSSLRTLSLGGCSLSAADIAPLCQALKKGIQLHMLKLSANRLEDQGVIDLSQALISCKTHPLAVLDLSSNSFGDSGAQNLAKIFTSKGHKSQLHSLNVTANSIGKDGLVSLVSTVGGKSPLHTLYIQNQQQSFKESDIEEVLTKLATGLGFNIKKLTASSADLPNLPDGLMVNLSSLGGHAGEIGAVLDSMHIITDYTNNRIPTMTFGHIQELCAYLKNIGNRVCVWSGEEWSLITGAGRPTTDAPSWLLLEASRSKALYISNLPGNTTQQKMDALFEMEADCSLDEVCLMKDPVTRSINGVGWVLMVDDQSVQKAVDFFISGEAKVFGQPIKISRINVKVDDEANSIAESKARDDFETRQKLKKQEAQDYKSLIQRTTEESWKRHAYRLAHPAYADGRIW